jgi:acyl-CoA thioesterase FadM
MSDGRFVMVAVDRKSFKSMPMPAEFLARLARFTLPNNSTEDQ